MAPDASRHMTCLLLFITFSTLPSSSRQMTSRSLAPPPKRRRIGVGTNHEHFQFATPSISFHEGSFRPEAAEFRPANPTVEGWEPIDNYELDLDENGQLFASELGAEVFQSETWSQEAAPVTMPLPKKRSKTSVRAFLSISR